MAEDPTTEELRVRQMKREEDARVRAEESPEEADTQQFDRRADKAAYLKRKLEERAEAEREADDLEHRTEELGEHVKKARDDWESKKSDESVPGAKPDEDEQSEGPPPEADITPGD